VDNNRPMIVKGDVVYGLATHARLTMYPLTLFIQYGTIEGDDFVPNGANEVLPLRVYPELCALESDGCWNLEEVALLLDRNTTEEFELSVEMRLLMRGSAAVTTGSMRGGW
jgi:hypothetical protein